jgi:hypothetical protein
MVELPIRNLNTVLDNVAMRPHDMLEQCLMSINRIGRATPGNRTAELIALLAEKGYFMSTDNCQNKVQD